MVGLPRAIPLPMALTVAEPVPFVARHEARERLEEAWRAVAEGGARRLVLVGADAGTGKTRLLTEFARVVHSRGGTVLYGTCSETAPAPYQPFAEALGHLATTRDATAELARLCGSRAGELGRLVPALARELPAGGTTGGDPDAERFRFFAAVAGVLDDLAAGRPLLIVLDDLHWAGRPTLLLLDHLCRGAGPVRTCLVGLHRSTGVEIGAPWREAAPELRRLPGTERLVLEPFDRAGVVRFVEAASGHRMHLGLHGVVELLVEETDGNAFLLGERWRHLIETGHLVQPHGRWRIERPLTDLASPEPVRDVVGSRVARLPARTQDLLTVAAVLGTRFSLAALGAATGAGPRAVLDDLEPALGAGLVLETGPDTYRFRHALIRRSVYDATAVAVRRSHHAAVADALEALLGTGAVGEVAHHLAAAVPVADPGLAVAAARRAARAAQAAVAHDDAACHLSRVLPVVPSTRVRAEVLLELADSRMRAGDVAAALECCVEAAGLARRLDERDLVVAAALAHEEANWRGALPGHATVTLLEDAAAYAADEATLVLLQAARGRALAFAGRGELGREVAETALARARALGDVPATRTAYAAVLFAPWTPDSTPRQTAVARELVAFARRTGDPESELWALDKLLYGLVITGSLDEVRELLDEHTRAAERLGQPLFRVLDLQLRAMLASGEGRLDDAERLAERAEEESRFLSANDAAGGYGVQMFGIRRDQGRLDEARPMVEAVVRLGRQDEAWRPALAALYAELGLLDAAAQELRGLVHDGAVRGVPRDALWWGALSYLADACCATGDRDAAAVLHRELRPASGLVVQVGTFLAAYGAVDRLLGELAAVLGRTAEAHRRFRAALDLEHRAAMPAWVARTSLSYGRFLAGRSPARASEAARLLRTATDLAARHGLTALRRRADAERERMPDRAAARPAAGLSARELEVLGLLARGLTNHEMGLRLRISRHTAANHVRSILAKSGCSNRTEVVGWALREGLVDELRALPGQGRSRSGGDRVGLDLVDGDDGVDGR